MGSIVEDLETLRGSATNAELDEAGFGDVDGEKVNSWPSLPSSSVGKSTRKKKKNNGGVSTIESTSSLLVPSAAATRSSGVIQTAATIGTNSNHHPGRRIFTSEFKQSVLEAYTSDPECIGNQRATARKFNIHRRQVQKWLTQLDKEGEVLSHSSSLDPGVFTPDGTSSNNDSPSSSSSSYDKEQENTKEQIFQPEQGDQPQDSDLSPTSNCSKVPVDLCTMSSAAMAMSLNLTQTPNPNSIMSNSIGHLKRPYHSSSLFSSELPRSNGSPSPTSTNHIVPPTIPSPNSLLSKFYSLYAPTLSRESNSIEPPKYQLPNLNGDSLAKGHLGSGPAPAKVQQSSSKPRRSNRQRQQSTNGTNNTMSHAHHIQILDEIAAAYPHDDFSLLRQAVLRNEVSFTKVPSSTPKSTFFPEAEASPDSNGRGFGRYNGKGGPEHARSRTSSPTSISPKNNQNQTSNNTLAQLLGQVLGPQDVQRQQTDYMRLVHQSAGLNFPDLSPEGIDTPNANNSISMKYPVLLAQAAATLGLPLLPTPPPPPHVNGQRKSPPHPHVFVSPKPPSSSKPKTKNRRKNSKPNQICDFQQDLEDEDLGLGLDVPLDMMIPIKKRRMSSQ